MTPAAGLSNSRCNGARACALAIVLLATAIADLAQAQPAINAPTGDPAMDAAIAKARTTLPTFWAALEKPAAADENFAVKIYYETPTGFGEHIWAVAPKRYGDEVAATIDAAPRDVADLKHGQRVTVPIWRLTDWFFFRDGRMHGGQTIRALLPTMPKGEAEKFRAMLAPE